MSICSPNSIIVRKNREEVGQIIKMSRTPVTASERNNIFEAQEKTQEVI
jgi:hypothetical protein